MTITATSVQRYTRRARCPICGGWDALPRGRGQRCHGFRGDRVAWCSREEYAGGLQPDPSNGSFAHPLAGPCGCGQPHGAADVSANGHRHDPETPKVMVAAYDYTDECGAMLYQAVRYTPKTFAQRRPDGRGGLIWSLKSGSGPEAPLAVRLVPYRLPELIGHTEVAIAEGEKDVDRVRSLGIPATCNAMGAGKWRRVGKVRPEYAAQLRAAGVTTVNVFRDRDGCGEAHAHDVEQDCLAAGLRVRAVHLPGDSHDVSDWLDAGHTADELRALIAAAPFLPAAEVATRPEVAGDAVAISGPEPEVVCLADVQPEAVRWVWAGRIAAGKLALVIGDPGEGKSYFVADTAARISRGAFWPDGTRAPLGAVLFLSAEDGLADTMRPRLDTLGADVTRIHVLRSMNDPTDPHRVFSLETDLPALEAAVRRLRPVLIVIDPLSAYLGDRDSYKDSEMRRLLTPLVMFAETHGVAVEAVMHLTKAADRRAIHRMIGSVAFSAISRLVLAVVRDPNDDGRRIVAGVKSNISKGTAALAFRLSDPPLGEQPTLTWESAPVEGVTADRLLGPSPDPEEREERLDAGRLLTQLLADGPMQALDVFKAAKSNGIAERTVNRAKRRLGIVAKPAGRPGKPGPWWWSLRDSSVRIGDCQPPAETATHGEVATSAQLSIEKDEARRTSTEVAMPPTVAASAADVETSGAANLRPRVVEVL